MATTLELPPPIVIRLNAWNGSAAGRTLIQVLLWDELSECYFIIQAWTRAGRKRQTIVGRRHLADGTYVGFFTEDDAGHGSACGIQPVRKGVTRIWIGHDVKGMGYVTYTQGSADTPFTRVTCLPNGDVSVDAEADQIAIKSGSLYRVYRLSAAVQGKAVLLATTRISNWFLRFQGFLLAGGKIYIHCDTVTKGKSMLRAFKVPQGSGTAPKVGEWVTTDWGDEAEGAVVKRIKGRRIVHAVLREGGDSPSRIVRAHPVEEIGASTPPPPPPKPIDPLVPTGTWVVLASALAAVDHKYGDGRDVVAYVRDKGYVIDTGESFVTAKDSVGGSHVYLKTKAGYRYALSSGPNRTGTPYLKKVKN